jgi:ankyrin repeat protein
LNRQLRGAAEDGDLNQVIRCLNDGADVNGRSDLTGDTALHVAAYNGHDSVVDHLCQHHANVNIKANDGWTPLHLACMYGHENVVITLLEYADVNIKDDDGNTPLDYTLLHGHQNIADLIKNSG